ncbi:MAG: ABC transporter ATP-binding protein [Bacillota bacterium]|nr:ABC transporter ATP-binding protein [Bacillota bacterium]
MEIRIQNLSKEYSNSRQKRIIFENTNFEFGQASSCAIVGRSGSGKSTLLRIISGMDIDYDGEFFLNGKRIRKNKASFSKYRFQNVAIIEQNPILLEDRDVYHNLIFPIDVKKIEMSTDLDLIVNTLQIRELLDEYPKNLSGGEIQRVAIAQALIQNPKLVLADEPTSELDAQTEKEVMDLFKILQKKGISFIISTHSPYIASQCTKQYIIQGHKLLPY